MPAWDEMDHGKISLVYFENGEKQVRIPDENEKGIKTLMGFHRSYARKMKIMINLKMQCLRH